MLLLILLFLWRFVGRAFITGRGKGAAVLKIFRDQHREAFGTWLCRCETAFFIGLMGLMVVTLTPRRKTRLAA